MVRVEVKTVAGREISNDVLAFAGAESIGLSGGILAAFKRNLLVGAILCGMLSVLIARCSWGQE